MKILTSTSITETAELTVEQSAVWELILGIAGYTHKQLRHTFELDEEWTAEHGTLPVSLVDLLSEIEKTNIWYGLILLQNRFAASSVEEFSKRLSSLTASEFYDCLLPYHAIHSEALRKQTALGPRNKKSWNGYADLFEGHEYLQGYVRKLHELPQKDTINLMTGVLNEWQNWVSKKEHWPKWQEALAFEQKQYQDIGQTNPVEQIEQITGGVEYLPEPSVWSIKLVPQVSYRPWVLTIRTADTRLFFYPLGDEHLLDPGVPSSQLVRGHKALGDELRLKLLFQLQEKPLSLQEMSIRFNISKTTLHHQLALLKAAKFIRAERGVYSLDAKTLEKFSSQLERYMNSST